MAPAPTATSGQNVAVDGMSWLPKHDSSRTLSRLCAPVSFSYHSRWERRQQRLIAGPKPDGAPTGVLTRRTSQRLERDAQRPNPIARADAYVELLELGAAKTRAEVAKTFGVSTAAVSYHIALIERLPVEFVSWLRTVDDVATLTALTERRLRPLTRIPPGTRQRDALRAILAAAVKDVGALWVPGPSDLPRNGGGDQSN